MSYAAHTGEEGSHHVAYGTSLGRTLREAVDFVAKYGIDVKVVGIGSPAVLYDLKADTKVDDAEPFFPVIVHTRSTDDDHD